MAKFTHLTRQEWEWMQTARNGVTQYRDGFATVTLTLDQFLRIVAELAEVERLYDQSDIERAVAEVMARKGGADE